jgi:signal transduction histidine kinase
MTRVGLRPLIVLIAGGALAAVLALALGTPVGDAAVLLGSTAAFSIVVAIVSRWLLARHRVASLRNQVLLASIASIATVAVGTLAAARLMFISLHDLNALIAVLTLAVAIAVAAALHLDARFATDSNTITLIARRMAAGSNGSDLDEAFDFKEMRDLALQLDAVSMQLELSRQREQALDRSRRELVSWVSHDLRSPLASIRALAEALEDGLVDDDADRARYYQSIRHESERLASLVDDLFQLSRLQSGAVPPPAGSVLVHELIDDAVTAMTPRAAQRGVRVECDIAGVGGCAVPAVDVSRAIRNVLDNAVRHTRSGGVVRLEGHLEDDAIVLAVIDECGGIPAGDLQRVFEPAFRGDGARGRDGGGGLGLAIARGLVESHSGSIDVHNHDLGCQFTIRIPEHDDRRSTRAE